jgi:Ca2+/Na+ antiporter
MLTFTMTFESIAILLIILFYFIYGIRTYALIRKIQTGHEPDHIKEEKIVQLRSNVKTVFIFAVAFILILFFSDLINMEVLT